MVILFLDPVQKWSVFSLVTEEKNKTKTPPNSFVVKVTLYVYAQVSLGEKQFCLIPEVCRGSIANSESSSLPSLCLLFRLLSTRMKTLIKENVVDAVASILSYFMLPHWPSEPWISKTI